MIKDNEAKIKEYEKEIQQVKIREKRWQIILEKNSGNNKSHKLYEISRKLNAEIAVLTQRQKDLKTEG